MSATQFTKVDLFGMSLPVPHWAAVGLGVVVPLTVGAAMYQQVFPNSTELVTLREANEQLAADVAEYNNHIMEAAEREDVLFEDMRGRLAVRAYSDGCLLIQRRNSNKTATRLIRDIVTSRPAAAQSLFSPTGHFAVLEAAQPGRCLNPHPGEFRMSYGARDGCWIQVSRSWPDGCEHVQMLNTCNGWWDANPDGSPRVRWTRCVH